MCNLVCFSIPLWRMILIPLFLSLILCSHGGYRSNGIIIIIIIISGLRCAVLRESGGWGHGFESRSQDDICLRFSLLSCYDLLSEKLYLINSGSELARVIIRESRRFFSRVKYLTNLFQVKT
jgi:hypothetical protein